MTLQEIKALKLALEALEQTLQTLDDENAKPGGAIADTIWHSDHETLFDYLGSEITAIKEALAEHAMQKVQRLGQEIEQEPVAKYSDIVSDGGLDPRNKFDTPPQQTWVGLNDDEIDYLIHLAYTGDEEFVQTIEAKLKEKNLPCIKPKWIGLTEKEHTDIAVECGCMSADWVFYGAAVERKLKERNT